MGEEPGIERLPKDPGRHEIGEPKKARVYEAGLKEPEGLLREEEYVIEKSSWKAECRMG